MRMGSEKKLRNQKLHCLYCSFNTVRVTGRLRCVGQITKIGEGKSAFNNLTGKPREWRPLGSPRSRWEEIIIMDLVNNRCEKLG